MCLKPSFCILESFGVWPIARRRREKKKLPDSFTYCEIPQLTRSLYLLPVTKGNATGIRLGRDWTSSKLVQQRNWTLGPAKGPLYPIWRNILVAARRSKRPSCSTAATGTGTSVSRSIRAQKDRWGDARVGYAGRTPANHAGAGNPGRGVAKRPL